MKDDDNFISRWSRRKVAARSGTPAPDPASDGPNAVRPAAPPDAASQPEAPAPAPLPPVDSLTFDSDFTGFMREGIDPDLRRAAIRTLVRDPRFNVMDGLDVYIDDYSKPDPIPADWMDKLNALKNLGHPVDEPPQEADENDDPGVEEASREAASPPEAGISEHDASGAPQQETQGPKTPDRGQ